MDLLSFFSRSLPKQIERARKKVKEPHGDPAVRINAARKLWEMGTPEALLALLDRFTISVSPSRQDEEEKEQVLSWIVGLGDRVVPPLVKFLKRERQVYWPLRALQAILPREQLVQVVDEILRYQWENPQASSEPRAQLIRFLEHMHSPALQETVCLYLQDEDDDARLAALDFFFRRPEEEAREPVLECYLDSEDRPRIRRHILERLAEVGWSVRGFRPRVEETLPEGYTLTRDGIVKVIGRKL